MLTPKLKLTQAPEKEQIQEALERPATDGLSAITDGLGQVQAVIFRGGPDVATQLAKPLSKAIASMRSTGQPPKLQAVAEMSREQIDTLRHSIETGVPAMITDDKGKVTALFLVDHPAIAQRMITPLTTWIDRIEAMAELPLSNPERPVYKVGDQVLFHDYSATSDRLTLGKILSVEWGCRRAAPLIWNDRKEHTGEVSENVYTIEYGKRELVRSESELLLPTAAEIRQIDSFCDWLCGLQDGDHVEAQISDRMGRGRQIVTGALKRGGPAAAFNDYPNVIADDESSLVSASSSYDLLIGPLGLQPVRL